MINTLWRFARRHLFSVAMILGSSTLAAAQVPDMNQWPSLAGQPKARQELITEYIRIPSKAQPPGSPAALNQTNFIRVRNRSSNPNYADAILIQAIPNGASSFSESAAQLVEMGALRGKNFQVWGIERREKLLEDLDGMRQAILQRDPTVALHYYYGDNFLGPDGKFAGKLGGAGAKYTPLTQADLPFLADYDAEVFNRDIESMLDLIPLAQRKTNVFFYSASPGGGFLSQFAGFKLSDGNRGYQEIAGIIAIEGQLTKSSIGIGEPTEKDVDAYIKAVQVIRDGTVPRFLEAPTSNLLAPGPTVAIPSTIAILEAEFAPSRESIFPIPPGAVGGKAADAFNANLRLTNLARAGYALSDDPLPGSFTSSFFLAHFGGGIGHLDFVPRKGAPVCAEPGPLGMKPPCIPSLAQIDPNKIYGWSDGGPGGPAVKGNPLEGWTINPDGSFTNAAAERGPNPGHLPTVVQIFARPAAMSNAVPLKIDLPTSSRNIDSGFNLGWAWYPSNRYHSVDVPFLNRFQKILIDRPDLHIHLDFDKTAIDIPIIEYTVHLDTANPWPNQSKDFTVVDPHGLTETPLAAQKSPMNPAMNVGLYKNLDIHSADNSAGEKAFKGMIKPGEVGANPTSDTLPDWIIPRLGKDGVDIPAFSMHPATSSQ